jgi:ribosomal protein S18 acetylase RimI-like enzyme
MGSPTAGANATEMTFVIRAATDADAEAIATVHIAAWRETYAGLVSNQRLESLNVRDRASRWAETLRDTKTEGRTSAFIVEAKSCTVGFSSFGLQRSTELALQGFDGEISAIYILKDAQRKGTGRRLVDLMAAELILRGLAGGSVWVLRENLPGRRFYETLGAKLIGERKDRRSGGEISVEFAYGWPSLIALRSLINTARL